MRFPDSFLDEIRDRVPISSVIGALVSWDRKKTNASRGDYWACCPFHGEKSPSFHCEDKKGRYHCFGCGVSGDHFRFLTELEGVSFPEAVERIAGMAGVPMPARDAEAEARDKERASLTDIMDMAAKFFQERQQSADGAKARAYLRDRGLTPATQQAFRLGYAPDSRNALKEFLAAKGVARTDMEALGLVVHGDGIPLSYDRFRDRIMFPIGDSRGRVIAFGGRALSPEVSAKYLNSPETELFHKGNVLYNFARARKAIGKDGTVIAVEGYMDVIALAQAGLDNVVAPLGTALTENQLELLWRMAGEPVLCFDGDQAGLKAAWRAADLALPAIQAGRTVRFALLPEGKDPDDLVRAEGPEAFRSVLAEARPLADLLWSRETAGGVFDTPERKAELEKSLRELTGRIKDESVRFHYAQEMRERVQTFFGSQRARPHRPGDWDKRDKGPGGQFARGTGQAGRFAVSESLARSAMVKRASGLMPLRESALLMALINYPQLFYENSETVPNLAFANELSSRLHRQLVDIFATSDVTTRIEVMEGLKHRKLDAMVELLNRQLKGSYAWASVEGAALEDAREAFLQTLSLLVRERELQAQRRIVEQALAEAVESNDEHQATRLLRELRTKSEEIGNLEQLEALIDGFGVMSGRARERS